MKCCWCSLSLSLFLWLFGISVGDSLSLSLSGAGETKPLLGGLGFPLCFSGLAEYSDFDPYFFTFTYTKALPSPCFFFSFVGVARLPGGGVFGLSWMCWASCWLVLWWWVSACTYGRYECICWSRAEGQDILHPFKNCNHDYVFGERGEDRHPVFTMTHRIGLAPPPPTPFLLNAVKDSPGRRRWRIAHGNRAVSLCLVVIPQGEMPSVFLCLVQCPLPLFGGFSLLKVAV